MGGLSEKQKTAVRESWLKITASWQTAGPDFFILLFNTFPAIKAYFKTLGGLSDDELRKTPKLKAHAVNFKHGVTSLVDNLDDADTLTVLVHKLTENHFRRKVTADQFGQAFNLFVKFAKDAANLDSFTIEAWQETLQAVQGIIAARMNELSQE